MSYMGYKDTRQDRRMLLTTDIYMQYVGKWVK